MKTYEEMARDALERIEAHETKQKKRRKTIARIAAPVAVCCLAVILGVGFRQSGLIGGKTPIADAGGQDLSSGSSAPEDAARDDTGKAVIPSGIDDSGEYAGPAVDSAETDGFCRFWWKNKLVTGGALYWALENDPDGTFAVSASYHPATAEITSFTFEGKTLAELAIDADNERMMPEKMRELLKTGESLKYGTALYQTGTPSGEKWAKELYEETVAYFGEELLDRYIVGGSFLGEKLERDIADYHENSAGEKYARAYAAYLETVLPSAVKWLTENGIECERDKDADDRLTLRVTAGQLEALPLEDLGFWRFDLVSDTPEGTPTNTAGTDDMIAVN